MNVVLADCGLIFGIIVAIFVITSLSKAFKTVNTTVSTAFDPDNLNSAFEKLQSMDSGAMGTSYGAAAKKTYGKKRPPINWNMIRLHLAPHEVEDCFDLSALKQGVKKEDLPQYVRLDRLKSLVPDKVLRSLIDLDFFEGSQEEPDGFHYTESLITRPKTVETPTPPQTAAKPHALISASVSSRHKPKPKPQEPKRAFPSPYESKPVKKVRIEVPDDKFEADRFSESFEPDNFSDRFKKDKPTDRFAKDYVSEGICRQASFMTEPVAQGDAIKELIEEPCTVCEIQKAFLWKEILSTPRSLRAYREY